MIPAASLHCSSVLASATTSSTATKLPTYINGLINGHKTPFLIDTGCETCILPSSLVKDEALTKCGTRMTAANGTPIASLGMIDLSFSFGDDTFKATFVVSPDTDEVILGQTFLQSYDITWSFRNNTLLVSGKPYQLYQNSLRPSCRRVSVSNDVIVPALSSASIPTLAL
jgi:hypothetical protein